MTQRLAEGDLDGEDGDLSGLDAVVLLVIEDQLDDRIAEFILNQGVDLVDPLGEDVIAQVQGLAHFAMLRAESGQHPHRAVGHRTVGAVDQRALLALGDRAQSLDRLVVVGGHHHGPGSPVIATGQGAPDRLQRGGPALRTVDPVGQFRRRGAFA